MLLGMVLLMGGCGGASPPPPPEFNGDAALAYVRTQLDFGPRIPGTEGHRRMAAWLDSLLRARADTVVVQAWDHTTVDGAAVPLRNFIARFNPAAATRLLFFAHWDTRPRSDGPGSRDSMAPVPGANDGASGVAVLLGMADALRKLPPAVGVDLLFVDGEDLGSFTVDKDVLIGSRYYAKNPLPGPKPLYAVLFDMIGDADLQVYQEGYSLTAAPEVVDLVWRTAAELGYARLFPAEPRHTLIDDHRPLQEAGFRAIDLIDFDYPAWHTPDDTFDKVSAKSLKAVGDVAMALVRKAK
jgi:glutaminyl-peptide cyclotransferase